MPYSPSGRNALCVVRDAHRCSAVVVGSHIPYSRSGRNALCIVRDANRYSTAVVTESYVPYSHSGRNALYLVRDAHRYSAVVIEGYAPYSLSGRNALLCSARRAPLQCRRYLEVTHPTLVQAVMHCCVVRDVHRCSAVVIESYEPYSRSGRNALLCSERRAPLQCRR